MTYLPKVAKAAPEMMANRSDRRLPNLLIAQAHHEADYVMRRRRADSIRTRARFEAHQKVGYMQANRLLQRSADALARGWVHICYKPAQTEQGGTMAASFSTPEMPSGALPAIFE